MTNAEPYQGFFLAPVLPRHRRYEMLRARFVEGLPAREIAARFAVSELTVRSQIRDFKRACEAGAPMEFFVELSPGPKSERKKPQVREDIVRLRARGYASTDIHRALAGAGKTVSLSLIDQVLRAEGLSGLGKRSRDGRERVRAEIESGRIPGLTQGVPAGPTAPVVADVREIKLEAGRSLYSRVAGVFLFVPFLLQAGLDGLVEQARMAGTKMIPSLSYVLSLLALKLLDKERKSHISDWNFDEALGWFAGLNVLPKTTAATDYAYRLVDGAANRLLAQWVRAAYPILCPEGAQAFALDFHAIPHRGEDTGLENHYVPMRGKAVPTVLTCFARALDAPMLCYAHADVVRKEQDQMPLRFVKYWRELTGLDPTWLYFDSKFTTYPVLDQLRQRGIHFITIRRRGTRLVRNLLARPAREWTSAVIDTPRRRHQRIRYLDDAVRLSGYAGACRQVATDFHRETPTLFLTDNEDVSGKEIITRYIARNAIENDLGINVNFFHLDCLASEVRLNVHADVVMTVLANGCYRWLSQRLKGCERMEPKQLYRKFVETGGHLTVRGDELIVSFDRRAHNPVIAQARLDQDAPSIPWLQNKRLRLEFK
ncbi:sigma-70 region 4 domain-containing protein [Candidatus Sumerlaeota bacterium]|nr:sigma-70 region 4 domain-containing protein [Candidatus Sumerlaeota bacterium]